MISRGVLQRLKEASWLKQAETKRLFTLLDGAAGRTRAVGGIVRDTLLDRVRDTAEIDFATELLPDDVMKRAGEAGISAYPSGIEYGTVTLKLDDLTAEITTLRQDIETNGRHAVVRFGTDWRKDAERRDFTLNALYAGPDGRLFDPLGGAEDCLAGVVRFIGDADRRIAEDRLRVYRFFRFSASHGGEQFDDDGLAAVTRAAGELQELSAERVGAEIRRMFELPNVARTLEAMSEAGVLVLPRRQLDELAGYERRAHRPNLISRLAVLLSGFDEAELKVRWRLYNDEVAAAKAVLAGARLLIEFNLDEAAYRYPASLSDAVDVAATLAGWTEAGKSAVLQRLAAIEVPTFPLSGTDLLQRGFQPGPRLGAELSRLEKKWIASGFALDRARLLAELQD